MQRTRLNWFYGPLNMGLCRALNFFVGLSVSPSMLSHRWPVILLHLFYIAGVTALSRNEVRGGERSASRISALWLTCAFATGVWILLNAPFNRYWGLAFFALLLYRISPVFWRAMQTLQPQDVRLAVKTGVLSLIVLNATIVACFAGPIYGLAILLFYLPASILARWFAVT